MNDKFWQWVGDYCSGALERGEEQELRTWLNESEENKQVFRDCVKMVREYQLVSCGDANREIVLGRLREKMHARKKKQLQIRYSVAAAVMVLLGISLLLMYPSGRKAYMPTPLLTAVPAGGTKATLTLENGLQLDLMQANVQEVAEQYGIAVVAEEENSLNYTGIPPQERKAGRHTITVPRGGEYHFTLADGSRVWLNSASRMTFPTQFTGATREVTVDGEVYFEVRQDREKPFIVHMGGVSVQVLGTKFCVSTYAENKGILTTLVEGAVKVTSPNDETILKPGCQAIVDQQTERISWREVELSLYTSWVKGIFEYENKSLEDIAMQLSRWYDVEFEFADAQSRERCFTGIVRKYMNLQDVLSDLEETTNVKFTVSHKKVKVSSIKR